MAEAPTSPRRTNRPLTIAALVLSVFMAALEATVVATAMPTVIADLGGLRLYGWVTAGYLLASTVSVPIYGKLADLYGRRPWLLVGMGLFLVGSMASGFSQSITQLIVFRVVQGLGAGSMVPLSLTVVSDIYSFEDRGKVQGFFSGVWGVSALVGPLVGGAIVQALSWRWVFFINVPLGLGAALLLVLAFKENIVKHAGGIQWQSAAMLCLGSTLLLGGAEGGHGLVLVPIGVLLLAAFVRLEKRAAEPILPIELFRDRLFVVSSVLTMLLGGVMFGTVSFMPLFVQGVLGGSPTEAGASISPMLVAWPITSAIIGRLLAKLGFRIPIVTGSIFVAAASLGLAVVVHEGTSALWLHVFTGAFGAGMGMAMPSALIAVQTSVRWEQRGAATASSMFFRTMGGSLVVGTLGSILAADLSRSFPPDVVAGLLDRSRPADTSAPLVIALASGIHLLFVIMACASFIAMVAALLFPRTDPVAMAGAAPTGPY
jgi:EmrB/QacA subfamily drug resistance transporter